MSTVYVLFTYRMKRKTFKFHDEDSFAPNLKMDRNKMTEEIVYTFVINS